MALPNLAIPASLAVAAVVVASGCGGEATSPAPSTVAADTGTRSGPSATPGAPAERTDSNPASGTGPTSNTGPSGVEAYRLESLQEQFPKPKPPEAKGSAAAIKAGEDACRGQTPSQVKEEFSAQSNLDPGQRELVAELPEYEVNAAGDPSFVAGQIAATVYQGTLPADSRSFGFQGCVYALARHLEAELAGAP